MAPADPEPGLDLGAYLARIGCAGRADASLATLRALHAAHPAAIPFENLDPFLGRPVRLDIAALQGKLVAQRRGGFCYEQNLLFMAVLRALGFRVGGLAARVLWGHPDGAVTARTHMLLEVACEGATWLADVGFGGLTQTAPLRFEPGPEQATLHEPFRIRAAGPGEFRVEARIGEEWRALYRFERAELLPVDCEAPSYFLSTSPDSRFVTGLMAARALPDRRLALAGAALAIHYRDGPTERRTLATPSEIAGVLERDFGIEVPDRTGFETALGRRGIMSAGGIGVPPMG